ncbi:MAG: hydrogenase formation protein HypD [Clostridiales bacterium]|jgi:hydrogenase expression/formation protein HypD|nr:hydrogenase formation protein HypD [Clostridiales bacterium]
MKAAQQAAEIIRNYDGKKLRIMEVCGTHTHEIFRQGIRKMLPENIQLISGPGCPVCVTPVSYIDEAVYLALEKGCLITTFGDLVRVPGTEKSLASARAEGAEIRPVYSPLDALQYAEEHPEKQVVFLSVGFETTTPPSLMAVRKAKEEGLKNFSILTANKTMDNAYLALKDSADAFLYPGHVSTISGTKIYYDLMKQGISGVVTGFTGPELLTALAVIVKKSQEGKPFFMNCYPRVVTDEGSPAARKLAAEMTDAVDSEWRGIGIIPKSGLQLKPEYADYDARLKYDMPKIEGHANPACRCGSVLKGEITPEQCPVFGKGCTPEHPVGACMVSGEGACAAFYKYGRDF